MVAMHAREAADSEGRKKLVFVEHARQDAAELAEKKSVGELI
jgi:hypothetical protein